jgi:hypothetical protein
MKKLEAVAVATETPRGEVRTPLARMLPRVMGAGDCIGCQPMGKC